MNKNTVLFGALCTATIFVLASDMNQRKIIPSGHMLPPMSPRTCQEYLELVKERQNQQNKYPRKNKKYALRYNNKVPLNQSSGSTSSTSK